MTRSDLDRRTFVKGIGAAGIAGGLAGCTGGPQGDGGGNGGGTQGGGGNGGDGGGEGTAAGTGAGGGNAGGSSDLNVGMVYALGGLGDKSFNDAAKRGVEKAKSQLGISYQEAQPSAEAEFAQFQRRFAQSQNPDFGLICCIGFLQQSALKDTSQNFSDQKFMIVDAPVENKNVASYLFKEHQGSFLVGHLAGQLTGMQFEAGSGKTNPDTANVGFVGGVDAPLIRKFQAGYEAGVKNANSDATVQVSYTGSFSDPTAGKEAALSMYNNGADIIYHAAGGTGVGVFQAAKEQNRYAIGVDSDQSKTEPSFKDVILASMVKRVDTAVFESIKNVTDDEFKGGKAVNLGLKRDGVAIVYGQTLGSKIPQEVKSKIDSSREKIINGEISVPDQPGGN